jgi:hypothetical protein
VDLVLRIGIHGFNTAWIVVNISRSSCSRRRSGGGGGDVMVVVVAVALYVVV